MKTVAVILAGGCGSRVGSTIPKQFMSLNGKTCISYVIDAVRESGVVDAIVIVMNHKKYKKYLSEGNGVVFITYEGKTRTKSIRNGLRTCDILQAEVVVFLDAVRPLVTPEHISRVIEEVKNGAKAVVTTQKITDVLGEVTGELVENHMDRNHYRLIQTPETFAFSTVWKVYENPEKESVAVSDLVKCPIKYIDIEFINLKITYAEDILNAEQLLKRYTNEGSYYWWNRNNSSSNQEDIRSIGL